MCVSLVCVLVLFRASVCVFRVSELLVVRLSFVVKLFCLRCVLCEIPRFSCRVLNSSFRVVFWSRISNSSFSFRRSIRLLEFRFEFVVEFDFSNFIALFDFSKSIVKFDFSKFDFSIQVPWIWWFEIVVEFRIRLFHRLDLFDFSNVDSNLSSKLSFSKSHSSFEFLIELFNFRRNRAICIALMHWRPQLFSHDRSRFALVATRALRALFVRKILVKRQFTFSLYFGIIEL